jgi:hypothetical protein
MGRLAPAEFAGKTQIALSDPDAVSSSPACSRHVWEAAAFILVLFFVGYIFTPHT